MIVMLMTLMMMMMMMKMMMMKLPMGVLKQMTTKYRREGGLYKDCIWLQGEGGV